MKLSLKKKLGWTHVRAGELVKVAKEHAVPTGTRTGVQTDWTRPKDDSKWIYCEVDDLAVEIVAVKTGNLLGHAYLSGPAIQLHRYGAAQTDWFAPAALGWVEIAAPGVEARENPEAWMQHTIGELLKIKYGELDVAAWRVPAVDKDDVERFGSFVEHAWSMAPHDKDGNPITVDPPPKTHLMVLVMLEKKKDPDGIIHFQPPKHAADICATHFQVAMVVEAAERQHGEAQASSDRP